MTYLLVIDDEKASPCIKFIEGCWDHSNRVSLVFKDGMVKLQKIEGEVD